MMKITSMNCHRTPYGEIYFGTAIDGDDSFRWFYDPCSLMPDVQLEREDSGVRFPIKPTEGARRAIFKAVKAKAN
jgi:hypothetical protein